MGCRARPLWGAELKAGCLVPAFSLPSFFSGPCSEPADIFQNLSGWIFGQNQALPVPDKRILKARCRLHPGWFSALGAGCGQRKCAPADQETCPGRPPCTQHAMASC